MDGGAHAQQQLQCLVAGAICWYVCVCVCARACVYVCVCTDLARCLQSPQHTAALTSQGCLQGQCWARAAALASQSVGLGGASVLRNLVTCFGGAARDMRVLLGFGRTHQPYTPPHTRVIKHRSRKRAHFLGTWPVWRACQAPATPALLPCTYVFTHMCVLVCMSACACVSSMCLACLPACMHAVCPCSRSCVEVV